MLKDLHTDTTAQQINDWTNARELEELDIGPSKYIRDIKIGFNDVREKSYDGNVPFFEKSTPFPIALLEKMNADLAISLGLSVAPCVISSENPQPTMISLGLYRETMSIVQGKYKALNLHNNDEEQLYNFAKDRRMVLDIMKRNVEGDLHYKLRPYRDLLSETLPFLLWARIHDPNLSNIIDRSAIIDQPPEKDAQRKSAYFIDLEGEESMLNPSAYTEADWDPKKIDIGDLNLILKDWLADGLPVEEIFNSEKIWQTIRRIQDMPDAIIRAEQERIASIVKDYRYQSPEQKTELYKGLESVGDMLIARRDQLADFVRAYIPEPAGAAMTRTARPAPHA